jgi:Nidogen-like
VITAGANNPIIAPFWADVDTRGVGASTTPGGNSTGANRVHYDLDTVNGVVTVTWDDVGYYNQHTNLLNAFQVQLTTSAMAISTSSSAMRTLTGPPGMSAAGTRPVRATPLAMTIALIISSFRSPAIRRRFSLSRARPEILE